MPNERVKRITARVDRVFDHVVRYNNAWLSFTWIYLALYNIVSLFIIGGLVHDIVSMLLHHSITLVLVIAGTGFMLILWKWSGNILVRMLRFTLMLFTVYIMWKLVFVPAYLPSFPLHTIGGIAWIATGAAPGLAELVATVVHVADLKDLARRTRSITSPRRRIEPLAIGSIALVVASMILVAPAAFGFGATVTLPVPPGPTPRLVFWGEPVNVGNLSPYYNSTHDNFTVPASIHEELAYCRDKDYIVIPGANPATFLNATRLDRLTLKFKLYKQYNLPVAIDAWIGSFTDDVNIDVFASFTTTLISWIQANNLTNVFAIVADLERSTHYSNATGFPDATRHAAALATANAAIEAIHAAGLEAWGCPTITVWDPVDGDADIDMFESLPLYKANWDMIMPQFYRTEFVESNDFWLYEMLCALRQLWGDRAFPFLGVTGALQYAPENDGLNKIINDINICRALGFSRVGFFTFNRYQEYRGVPNAPIGILNNWGFAGMDAIEADLASPPATVSFSTEGYTMFFTDTRNYFRKFDGAQLLVNAQITIDLWLNPSSWVVVMFVLVIVTIPNVVAMCRVLDDGSVPRNYA